MDARTTSVFPAGRRDAAGVGRQAHRTVERADQDGQPAPLFAEDEEKQVTREETYERHLV